jgi:intein-encoded DNA endonuclease-like protein
MKFRNKNLYYIVQNPKVGYRMKNIRLEILKYYTGLLFRFKIPSKLLKILRQIYVTVFWIANVISIIPNML